MPRIFQALRSLLIRVTIPSNTETDRQDGIAWKARVNVPKECRYLVKDFGTSLSPKSTRLRDSRYGPGRPASVPLRHTIASSAQAPQHSHNGLTAFRMRLHMLSAGYGTCGPFATPTIRPRLRLPGTTRIVLRTSMAGSEGP